MLQICLLAWLFIGYCFAEFRYKREEVKIQAWENHEKKKTELEMKRIEVWFSRMVCVSLHFCFGHFPKVSSLLQLI